MNYENAIKRLRKHYGYFIWGLCDDERHRQLLLSPLDNIITQSFKDSILNQYENFLLKQYQRDDPEFQTLLTGLDNLLNKELRLKDYSGIEPRQVPNEFQLSPDELSDIAIEDPHAAVDVEELRALYGSLGGRAYNDINPPRTLGNLKDRLTSRYTTKKHFMTKSLLAMEDFLIWKTGYSKKI